MPRWDSGTGMANCRLRYWMISKILCSWANKWLQCTRRQEKKTSQSQLYSYSHAKEVETDPTGEKIKSSEAFEDMLPWQLIALYIRAEKSVFFLRKWPTANMANKQIFVHHGSLHCPEDFQLFWRRGKRCWKIDGVGLRTIRRFGAVGFEQGILFPGICNGNELLKPSLVVLVRLGEAISFLSVLKGVIKRYSRWGCNEFERPSVNTLIFLAAIIDVQPIMKFKPFNETHDLTKWKLCYVTAPDPESSGDDWPRLTRSLVAWSPAGLLWKTKAPKLLSDWTSASISEKVNILLRSEVNRCDQSSIELHLRDLHLLVCRSINMLSVTDFDPKGISGVRSSSRPLFGHAGCWLIAKCSQHSCRNFTGGFRSWPPATCTTRTSFDHHGKRSGILYKKWVSKNEKKSYLSLIWKWWKREMTARLPVTVSSVQTWFYM